MKSKTKLTNNSLSQVFPRSIRVSDMYFIKVVMGWFLKAGQCDFSDFDATALSLRNKDSDFLLAVISVPLCPLPFVLCHPSTQFPIRSICFLQPVSIETKRWQFCRSFPYFTLTHYTSIHFLFREYAEFFISVCKSIMWRWLIMVTRNLQCILFRLMNITTTLFE